MTFQGPAITNLQDRTEYESWLLEEVYEITDQRIAVEGVDELVYPPTGAPPTQTVYGMASINIGDWRPGFLEAGAPLVLVTAFKLLDMILEWVLVQNGQPATFRFSQKLVALQGSIQFPQLIASRPWLQRRLLSLYTGLEPLRGTIIHDRHFQTSSGDLRVAISKKGSVRAPVALAAADLRRISAFGVSLIRYLEGTWALDLFREKRLRFWLDQLAHVHNEPLLGQQEPGFLNIRIYSKPAAVFSVDLPKLRRDAIAKRPGQDVLFDVKLVVADPISLSARAFLIPWSRHEQERASLQLTPAELETMPCPLPGGLNIEQLVSQLTAG